MAVDRYKQLLASIPTGSFYASSGQVLPLRSSPYTLRMTTGVANKEYQLYLNDNARGYVTTDGDGVASVSVLLVKGDNVIKLLDPESGNTTSAYVTARDYATMLAAEAEVISKVDADIEQVLLDSRLETSSPSAIEEIFGKPVSTPNDANYSTDAYREMLQELRAAYRFYGSTVEGIYRAVRAFTQISPVLFNTADLPRWLLGADRLYEAYNSTHRSAYVSVNAGLVASQGTGANMSIVGLGYGVMPATSKFYLSVAGPVKRLHWRSDTDTTFPLNLGTVINGNGTYTVYDTKTSDIVNPILGEAGPAFNISAGANDILALDVGGRGIIEIPLTPGPARTLGQVTADINNAFSADPRYGPAYNGIALVSGSNISLNVDRSLLPNDKSISICNMSGATDAAQTLFNVPCVRGGLNALHAIGATTLQLSASTDMTNWPDATADAPLRVKIGRTTFHPLVAPNAAATITTPEIVNVVSVNKGAKTITISPGLVNAQNTNVLVELDGQMPYVREATGLINPIYINIGNYTALPNVGSMENFTIAGTGLYDGWLMTTSSGGAATSAKGCAQSYFDRDRDLPFVMATDTMISMPLPSDLLKYKGHKIKLTVWGSCRDFASVAPPLVDMFKMGFSFDDQTTYNMIVPTTAGSAVHATYKPKQYVVSDTIPSSTTKMWARFRLDVSSGTFTVDRIRVTIEHAETGLTLGSFTTPRSETRVKQGELICIWSRDILTSAENKLLGMLSSDNGHIDTISPASIWYDKFNASKYTLGVATNVVGAVTDAHFTAGASSNMSLVARAPSRFSYMKPTLISMQEETVTIGVIAPYTATLSHESDQDATLGVLFENDIPLTKDEWSFASNTSINKTSAPDTTAIYKFRYSALNRFTTEVLDIGASRADFLWFVDCHAWTRPEVSQQTIGIEAGMQFDGDGVAVLPEQSNKDKMTTTITEETGISKRIVPIGEWEYLDSSRIRIDINTLNQNALYTIKYSAIVGHVKQNSSIKIEIRSASTSVGVAGATWGEVHINDIIDSTYQYHQLRVTMSDITDIRDIRLQSLVLKGLELFNGATIPVFNP